MTSTSIVIIKRRSIDLVVQPEEECFLFAPRVSFFRQEENPIKSLPINLLLRPRLVFLGLHHNYRSASAAPRNDDCRVYCNGNCFLICSSGGIICYVTWLLWFLYRSVLVWWLYDFLTVHQIDHQQRTSGLALVLLNAIKRFCRRRTGMTKFVRLFADWFIGESSSRSRSYVR